MYDRSSHSRIIGFRAKGSSRCCVAEQRAATVPLFSWLQLFSVLKETPMLASYCCPSRHILQVFFYYFICRCSLYAWMDVLAAALPIIGVLDEREGVRVVGQPGGSIHHTSCLLTHRQTRSPRI
jgi:hypothetical protein